MHYYFTPLRWRGGCLTIFDTRWMVTWIVALTGINATKIRGTSGRATRRRLVLHIYIRSPSGVDMRHDAVEPSKRHFRHKNPISIFFQHAGANTPTKDTSMKQPCLSPWVLHSILLQHLTLPVADSACFLIIEQMEGQRTARAHRSGVFGRSKRNPGVIWLSYFQFFPGWGIGELSDSTIIGTMSYCPMPPSFSSNNISCSHPSSKV
jgi:hypothetical protein